MESITPENHNTDQVVYFSEEEIRHFIGRKADYYFSQWNAFYGPNPPLKVCWNWTALLIGPFWLGYRKMYMPVMIYMGVIIAVDLFQMMFLIDLSAVKYGMLWMLGIVGNMLYYKHTHKKMTQIKAKNMNPLKTLQKAGGVSWLGVGFVILLIVGCEIGSMVYKILIDVIMDF